MSVFMIAMAVWAVVTIFVIYMIYRNDWVFMVRTDLIWSDPVRYRKLPSYDAMVWRYPFTWSVEAIERKTTAPQQAKEGIDK